MSENEVEKPRCTKLDPSVVEGRRTRGIKRTYTDELDIGSLDSNSEPEEIQIKVEINEGSNDYKDFDVITINKRSQRRKSESDDEWNPSDDEIELDREEIDDEHVKSDESVDEEAKQSDGVTYKKAHINDDFVCSSCEERFTNEQAAASHVRTHNYTFKCNQCYRHFKTEKGLDFHEGVIHADIHRCNECMFECKKYDVFRVHCRNKHPNSRRAYDLKKFMCDVCALLFQHEHLLQVHLFKEHKLGKLPKPNFICETCGSGFFYPRELARHNEKQHQEKTVCCKYKGCEYKTVHLGPMKKHYNLVHLGLRRHKCTVEGCKLTFESSASRTEHVNMVHLKVRTIYCTWPECNKTFFAQKHLKVHMQIHSDEKPLKCELCDYRCRQRTALNWHLKKHGIFKEKNKKDYEAEALLLNGRKGKPGRKPQKEKSRSRYKKVIGPEDNNEKKTKNTTRSKRKPRKQAHGSEKKPSMSNLEDLKASVALLENFNENSYEKLISDQNNDDCIAKGDKREYVINKPNQKQSADITSVQNLSSTKSVIPTVTPKNEAVDDFKDPICLSENETVATFSDSVHDRTQKQLVNHNFSSDKSSHLHESTRMPAFSAFPNKLMLKPIYGVGQSFETSANVPINVDIPTFCEPVQNQQPMLQQSQTMCPPPKVEPSNCWPQQDLSLDSLGQYLQNPINDTGTSEYQHVPFTSSVHGVSSINQPPLIDSTLGYTQQQTFNTYQHSSHVVDNVYQQNANSALVSPYQYQMQQMPYSQYNQFSSEHGRGDVFHNSQNY